MFDQEITRNRRGVGPMMPLGSLGGFHSTDHDHSSANRTAPWRPRLPWRSCRDDQSDWRLRATRRQENPQKRLIDQ